MILRDVTVVVDVFVETAVTVVGVGQLVPGHPIPLLWRHTIPTAMNPQAAQAHLLQALLDALVLPVAVVVNALAAVPLALAVVPDEAGK